VNAVSAVGRRPLATTEDQSATFIELFFDLVFVYAVTQTVSLVHEDLSWTGLGRAVVVFWLVWWAWTQYTWALNSADTAHPAVDAVMLVATAIAFLMAVTVPDAFGDAGAWFAAMYIVVRAVGLGLYGRVAWDDVAKRAAVRKFAVLSLGGLAAVAVGGLVDGEARAWLWAAALLLDVVAAALAGAAEGWDIRPDHFGERHGLFVIIALGESLVVAAAGRGGGRASAGAAAGRREPRPRRRRRPLRGRDRCSASPGRLPDGAYAVADPGRRRRCRRRGAWRRGQLVAFRGRSGSAAPRCGRATRASDAARQ
jgi:low temperature requirement protein LtrA